MCETGMKLWCVSLLTEQRAEWPMVVLATPSILNHIAQSGVRPCWGEHILRVPAVRIFENKLDCAMLKTSFTDGTVVVVVVVVEVGVVEVGVVVQPLRSSDTLGLTHQGDLNDKCWDIKGWSIYSLRGAFTPCHKSKSIKGTLHLQNSTENYFIFSRCICRVWTKNWFILFQPAER